MLLMCKRAQICGTGVGSENIIYLTRHIYVDNNSGDRNYGGTKIWEFFSEIPKFRTPN